MTEKQIEIALVLVKQILENTDFKHGFKRKTIVITANEKGVRVDG